MRFNRFLETLLCNLHNNDDRRRGCTVLGVGASPKYARIPNVRARFLCAAPWRHDLALRGVLMGESELGDPGSWPLLVAMNRGVVYSAGPSDR